MKLVVTALAGLLLLAAPGAAKTPQPQPRVLELKTSDGTATRKLSARRSVSPDKR